MRKLLRRRRWIYLAVLLAAAVTFWHCLPEPLFHKPWSTVMLDRDGRLLAAHIAADGQWRFPAMARVPDKFKQALLQFEDKRFYSHIGIDPLAIGRAAYLNAKHRRTMSGASTLTMQVIRLARENPPRTFGEKLWEMVLALRLELAYDKDAILALHASHAPFGGNVVGLEAASWRYFGRAPDQLSWAEATTLAVLPNSPALIHPGRNRQRLRAKRDALLRRLHAAKKLKELELKLALLEPLPERPRPLPRLAPHLLDSLRTTAAASPRIHTTVEHAIQAKAEAVTRRHALALETQGIHNLAAVIIDNERFEVLAYIGNSRYSNTGERGYAVDIVHRRRSSGSILKPLLFARMIQSGELLPDTLVADVPTQYAGYMPENYDRRYRGAVPAKEALARSLNVPAVRMLRRHGIKRFYDFLQNAGVSTLDYPADHYGLSLILGGSEVTLWDMTSLYANLAHIAKRNHHSARARYRRPTILRDQTTTTERAAQIGPATAWLTLDALEEVARPGAENYWRSFASSRRVAWKTGTSYGLRDGWAIGSDPRYTIGVWVGNATGEGKAGLTGILAAAPVLFDLFDAMDRPTQWFAKPTHLMKPVQVCTDNGYLASAQCASKTVWIPQESHFQQSSPHHRYVHLDANGQWRVHARCERVDAMRHASWFSLPPTQAYYYRRAHTQYHHLPPLRPDCRAQDHQAQSPIGLLYPLPGTRIYIPTDLGQHKSRTVFEAVHRDDDALLYWHLDQRYLGKTEDFHQLALRIDPGIHYLTVVDQDGNRLSRRFEVLGAQASPSATE